MLRYFSILLLSLMLPCAAAHDGLPTLRRSPLPAEVRWELETELTTHRGQNGAMQECLANSLSSLLTKAGKSPTVEHLVQVLTEPSETGSPESSIKELLMPGSGSIQVSPDATLAVITTPVYGGYTLEIYQDSTFGLRVYHLIHKHPR